MNVATKEKIIFSASNASEEIKSYLSFSDEFEIGLSGNKSKIILGANGVGKTSIFREIRRNDSSNQYIDYDTIKDDFIKNGSKITIGAKIKILEEKKDERGTLISKLDVKNRIKEKFLIKTQKEADAISAYLGKLWNDKEQAGALKDFSSSKFEEIRALLPEQIDFLFKNVSQVSAIQKAELEIKNIRDGFLEIALNHLDKYLAPDEKKCPVCDIENKETIKKVIEIKKSSFVQLENALIKKVSGDYPAKNADEIKQFLNKIKDSIKKNHIAVDDIVNFVISGGEGDSMSEAVRKLAGLNDEIKELGELKESFFNFLMAEEANIKDEFEKIFQIHKEDIDFDVTAKEIKIELKRKVDTYSTGEINLMVFAVYIHESLASDKNLIVIDDPLSSYDIINQYKIIYKIVAAHNKNKKLLIFTHNIDTINISNSQYSGLFEYQYIEKHGDKLDLQDIEPIDGDTFMKAETLLILNDDVREKYIKLLIKKEKFQKEDPLHKLFHYDEAFVSKEFTNEYLVSLIDGFGENFENKLFRENCINKIIYLTAIRVWVEKQFWINNKEDKNLHGKQFGEKVAYLFSEEKPQKWTGSSKVTRSFLMSKKVMLNQNTHVESQTIPFEYALNLSLDNLAKEIVEIKEAFSSLE